MSVNTLIIETSTDVRLTYEVKAFTTVAKAIEYLETEEKNWIKKYELDEDEGYLDEILIESLVNDENFYKHYIHCDGSETVFSLEVNDIE